MAEPPEMPERWLTALTEARSGERLTTVVWFGDSMSELDPNYMPLPWFVGRALSGWTEEIQYRNAGAEFTPSMQTTGSPSADEAAGFGGRSVDLRPGQSCTLVGVGSGVSMLWTRRPGGGSLEVRWGDDLLEVIDTDGPLSHSQLTEVRREPGHITEPFLVTATGAEATLEGAYLHAHNLDHGLRVWPAVRSGNNSQHFLDRPGWGLESLATLHPDLVVMATGTNVADDYGTELAALIDAVRARTDADVVVWLPYINDHFSLEEAAVGRLVAAEKGCAVIDAAADLGVLPTVDGTHPDAVGAAVAGAHAAAVLSGDPVGTATQLAGYLAVSHGRSYEWRPGAGTISIEEALGSTVLSGRALPGDHGQQWALLLGGFAKGLFGLPGATLSLGPGAREPIDTHISRAGAAHVSLNDGKGRLDLAHLRFTAGDDPDPQAAGPLLYARNRGDRTELALLLPDGSAHVLAPAPVSGYRAPVPCALAPPHRPSVDGLELRAGRVIWLPFPVLEQHALATHVWVHVLAPGSDARATAAIVATGPDGRPGDVVRSTDPGAIDMSAAGMAGAPLQSPARVAAGEQWWVAIVVRGGGDTPVVGAAEALEGRPVAQIGPAPVVPSADLATGALALDGQDAVPPRPGAGLTHVTGPVPVLRVSLEAP